jgi:hypothetical protein
MLSQYDTSIERYGKAEMDARMNRINIDELLYQKRLYEASVIRSGVDGRNQTERSANLLLQLKNDPNYMNILRNIRNLQTDGATIRRELVVAQERVRKHRNLAILLGEGDE